VTGVVISVHVSPTHTFSKRSVDAIKLIEGQGIEGDAHCGVTVKHRSHTGAVVRLAGIMGTVARGGLIRPGDAIRVELPPPPHFPLTRV
jgi:hypothetical protein